MNKHEVFHLILQYFQGDHSKTWAWFRTPNPGLGNIKPWDMVKEGRVEKLALFIKNQIEGNYP